MMKVNMALINGNDPADLKEEEPKSRKAKRSETKAAAKEEKAAAKSAKKAKKPKKSCKEEPKEPVEVEESLNEEDKYDNSNKHSKWKTFLLVTAMVSGFALFVWCMIGWVNNTRLDNQGQASIIYELKDEIMNFMGGSEGSAKAPAEETSEGNVSEDAIRDGPSGDSGYTDESPSTGDTIDGLKQEIADLKNENALLEQEKKITEDYLDSALNKEQAQQTTPSDAE